MDIDMQTGIVLPDIYIWSKTWKWECHQILLSLCIADRFAGLLN